MFWHKLFHLLCLFAFLGNAAPITPLEGDVQEFENITSHNFEKRATYQHIKNVWRADARAPSVIVGAMGFKTKAYTNNLWDDLSLYRHCLGGGGISRDNDGYVSTTHLQEVADWWIRNKSGGNGWIYAIALDDNLVDVAATLGRYSPFPKEYEFAAMQGVPLSQIMGWIPYWRNKYGKVVTGDYEDNQYYRKAAYQGRSHAGAQYPLAGFPDGHEAWSSRPWMIYAVCKSRGTSKRAEEIFANQSPSGLDIHAAGTTNTVSTNSLEARARSRGSSKSKKRPSAAGKRKRPAKKTTKKCTVAMKKTGKCGTAAAKKCTPAMKKAGKCPATCTAAEKKANGGKCPTCTAAEKKKNGGKCPAKKGQCGPIVSNNARYKEYLKALKQKKAGKKMQWSTGGTSTGGKSTKGGKTHA